MWKMTQGAGIEAETQPLMTFYTQTFVFLKRWKDGNEGALPPDSSTRRELPEDTQSYQSSPALEQQPKFIYPCKDSAFIASD